jgi:hypothetical protein
MRLLLVILPPWRPVVFNNGSLAMSLRMPIDLARLSRGGMPATNLSTIEAEALAESASSLGHHGRKVEAALASLRSSLEGEGRAKALGVAADAVWAYFVQRELCGLRDHRLIIREMDIPNDVLNRLGAVSKT